MECIKKTLIVGVNSEIGKALFNIYNKKNYEIYGTYNNNLPFKNIKENWGYKIDTNLAYPTAIGKAGSYFKIPLEKLLIAFLQSFISKLYRALQRLI